MSENFENEPDEIKKWGDKIKRKDLKHITSKYKYDFQQNETIRSFDESIYNDRISIHEPEMDQTNLLENMIKFKTFRPETIEGKDKKRNKRKRKKSSFPIKEKQGKGLKR